MTRIAPLLLTALALKCHAAPEPGIGPVAPAYASLSAVFLFSGMNRLQGSGERAKKIGAEAKRGCEDALDRTGSTASEALGKNGNDTNALLSLVIATGAERDFAALVEKRLKDSDYAAKASRENALRLQAIDPAIQDAWFARGFSEYLVGSVPFVIRWLMKIDQVDGNKKEGVELMEKCVRGGRHHMLEAFAADHPENQVLRIELAKLPKSRLDAKEYH